MRIRRLVPAVSLAAVLVPAIAGAQWKITTFGGVYAPTTDVGKMSATSGSTTASVAFKHKPGFVLGANANKWFNDRAGFEATFGYAWSDGEASGAINGPEALAGTATESAHLILANAKLLVKVTPPNAAAEMYFGAGPALVAAGGKAYQETDSTKIDRGTNFGGVASFGLRYKIAPAMALKLGAESYLYSTSIKLVDNSSGGGTVKLGSKFQTDFVIHAGVSFTLPGMSQ